MSYSYTTTETFTLTDARRLAAKVTSDLRQCQYFYGRPSDTSIDAYQEELTVLLHGGYVESYEFGFQTSDGHRVLSWSYTVGPAGDLEGGRSGGLYASADISNALWFNHLTYTAAWFALSLAARERVRAEYTLHRTTQASPSDGDGYWESSRHYTSGGVAVTRKEFRPW
jgi:hypothetical protein